MSANNDPATGVINITPSDSEYIPQSPGSQGVRSFYVTVAGDVQYESGNGVVAIFPAAAGQIIPIKISKVYATNTTATGIVGLL